MSINMALSLPLEVAIGHYTPCPVYWWDRALRRGDATNGISFADRSADNQAGVLAGAAWAAPPRGVAPLRPAARRRRCGDASERPGARAGPPARRVAAMGHVATPLPDHQGRPYKSKFGLQPWSMSPRHCRSAS